MKKTGIILVALIITQLLIVPSAFTADEKIEYNEAEIWGLLAGDIVFTVLLLAFPDNQLQLRRRKKAPCFQWGLIMTDLALMGVATYAVFEQRRRATVYNEMYDVLNDTTPENYNILLKEREKVDAASTMSIAAIATAGTFVLYTIIDKFFIHAAFLDMSAGYDPAGGQFKFAVSRRF